MTFNENVRRISIMSPNISPMSIQVRTSAAHSLLGMSVRIQPGIWMSVSCECCVLQVEVSALGRSLVQRNLTERGVSTCVWSRSLDIKEALAHEGMRHHGKYITSISERKNNSENPTHTHICRLHRNGSCGNCQRVVNYRKRGTQRYNVLPIHMRLHISGNYSIHRSHIIFNLKLIQCDMHFSSITPVLVEDELIDPSRSNKMWGVKTFVRYWHAHSVRLGRSPSR